MGQLEKTMHHASLVYGTLIFLAIAMPWYALRYKTPGFLDTLSLGGTSTASFVSGWQRWTYMERSWRAANNLGIRVYFLLPWSHLLIWQWVRSIKDDKRHRRKRRWFFVVFSIYGCCAMLPVQFSLVHSNKLRDADCLHGAIVGLLHTKDHYQRGYTKSAL